jgi:hypothetical protein
MAKLTTKKRNALPESTFALPGRRYPINDPNHARNALARVSQHGSPSEKSKVRAAVHRKYPTIGKMHEGGKIPQTGLYEMEKDEVVIPKDESKNGVARETVSSTPNMGNPMCAHPTIDGGHDSGCGHWEGDSYDVKWHKS